MLTPKDDLTKKLWEYKTGLPQEIKTAQETFLSSTGYALERYTKNWIRKAPRTSKEFLKYLDTYNVGSIYKTELDLLWYRGWGAASALFREVELAEFSVAMDIRRRDVGERRESRRQIPEYSQKTQIAFSEAYGTYRNTYLSSQINIIAKEAIKNEVKAFLVTGEPVRMQAAITATAKADAAGQKITDAMIARMLGQKETSVGQMTKGKIQGRVRRIAMTEISAAYNLGRLDYLIKNGYSTVIWDAYSEVRNTNVRGYRTDPNDSPCSFCRTFDKQEFDISLLLTQSRVGFTTFLNYEFPLIPAHPHCLCVYRGGKKDPEKVKALLEQVEENKALSTALIGSGVVATSLMLAFFALALKKTHPGVSSVIRPTVPPGTLPKGVTPLPTLGGKPMEVLGIPIKIEVAPHILELVPILNLINEDTRKILLDAKAVHTPGEELAQELIIGGQGETVQNLRTQLDVEKNPTPEDKKVNLAEVRKADNYLTIAEYNEKQFQAIRPAVITQDEIQKWLEYTDEQRAIVLTDHLKALDKQKQALADLEKSRRIILGQKNKRMTAAEVEAYQEVSLRYDRIKSSLRTDVLQLQESLKIFRLYHNKKPLLHVDRVPTASIVNQKVTELAKDSKFWTVNKRVTKWKTDNQRFLDSLRQDYDQVIREQLNQVTGVMEEELKQRAAKKLKDAINKKVKQMDDLILQGNDVRYEALLSMTPYPSTNWDTIFMHQANIKEIIAARQKAYNTIQRLNSYLKKEIGEFKHD